MSKYTEQTTAVSKRLIGDHKIFESKDPEDWEQMYTRVMDPKYKKETRNFNITITGKKTNNPLIFLIPRIRGGASYKETKIIGANNEDLQYCAISKGYPMQDVSSFTLGPVFKEGLCLVNSAFSKAICIMHIEGGGKVNLKRKNYWQRSKKPERSFQFLNTDKMIVTNISDGKTEEVNIHTWLSNNENLWLDEWEIWRKNIALTNIGDFHWNDDKTGDNKTISYRYKEKYLNFVQWKKQCYITPFYELAVKTEVYKFLDILFHKEQISLGLVHPKASEGDRRMELPITEAYIRNIYDSETIMCCVPYCVAGLLLDVSIY